MHRKKEAYALMHTIRSDSWVKPSLPLVPPRQE